MVTNSDLLIAGAGPAGVATAIHAAMAGFTVQIVDGLRPPVDKACGEGLMPDAMRSLARLGVTLGDGDSWPFRGIRFVTDKHSVEAAFPGQATGAGIRRTRLSNVLVCRAEQLGVRFQWESTVRALNGSEVRSTTGVHRARWIVAADGHHSTVRKLAGLDDRRLISHRIGLRQHFSIAPWTEFVEVYWGTQAQAYVTPVAPNEVCVAIITRRKPRSFESELRQFRSLAGRLSLAQTSDAVIGGATMVTHMGAVARGNVALVGDASGAVDALTGEGLRLCFRQAELLVNAMLAGDLDIYRHAHSELRKLPCFMSGSLLLLDRSSLLRNHALRVFARHPDLFASMLQTHVGEQMPVLWGRNGILSLGTRLLFT